MSDRKLKKVMSEIFDVLKKHHIAAYVQLMSRTNTDRSTLIYGFIVPEGKSLNELAWFGENVSKKLMSMHVPERKNISKRSRK